VNLLCREVTYELVLADGVPATTKPSQVWRTPSSATAAASMSWYELKATL
jgi:hypothetical protein